MIMKVLCFVDLHGDKPLLKKLIKRAKDPDIDLVLMAGDLTNFEDGLRYFLKKLNSIGKKVLVIPGNHEEHKDFDPKLKDIISIHNDKVVIKNKLFIGCGGGFRGNIEGVKSKK